MSYSWYVQRSGDEEGPLTASRLAEMAREGALLPNEYIRRSDMEKWVPAGRVKGLQFRSTMPALPDAPNIPQVVNEVRAGDGRLVLLMSDGTWKYSSVESNSQSASGIITQPRPPIKKHFRKASWGMSEREVRDTEAGDPIFDRQGALAYEGTVAGLSCRFYYIFVNDQLVRGKIRFTEEHTNDNEHINDYLRLKELLTEKYGTPIARDGRQSDQIWMNDLYQDEYESWGTAIGAGHLVFLVEWRQPDSKVSLILHGDNYEVQLAIEYISTELESLEDDATRQKHLEDL